MTISKQILNLKNILKIHPKVSNALKTKSPIVALESTILTHGLPYPENYNMIRNIQNIALEYNVVPATIALQQEQKQNAQEGQNKIIVGFDNDDDLLHDLCIANNENRVKKVTTRELPFFLSSSYGNSNNTMWGGTTVASTMHIASLVGISTFVTGGTGGVHRRINNESIADISSDLLELSRTPVLVISAGIKSILDIKQTIETLETLSVPVGVYKHDKFPAFFSKNSNVTSPYIFNNIKDIANSFIYQNEVLNMNCGMLLAVPPPISDANDEMIEYAIQDALKSCHVEQGKDVTPYILKKVNEITKGNSLKNNLELIYNNVHIGAQIAIEISNIQKQQGKDDKCNTVITSTYSSNPTKTCTTDTNPKVIIMGGSVIDIIAKPKTGKTLLQSTSNPGICVESDGGVGRNIHEVISRLGTKTSLYSAIGNDTRGHGILSRLHTLPNSMLSIADNNTIQVIDKLHTATYVAILKEDGDLNTAIADMDIMDNIPIPDEKTIKECKMLILDANPSIENLIHVANIANKYDIPVFLEPTSIPKAKIISNYDNLLCNITYASPNFDELLALLNIDTDNNSPNKEFAIKYVVKLAKKLLIKMKKEKAYLLITLGEDGVLYVSKKQSNSSPTTTDADNPTYYEFETVHVKPKNEDIITNHNNNNNTVNFTGAGDTFTGAFTHAIINNDNNNIEDSIHFAMKAANISIKCVDSAISPELDHLKLE